MGHAPLDSKVTAFQSLVDALANKRKLGVIDEHHVLPTAPPSATVIDADGKGVDAIHHTIREDNITAVAFPTMRRGDIVHMLMDYAGQENGQVLMINEGMSDAVQTLRGDLPMMLLKSSPSGHTEFSDAAIKAMDPVVVTLDRNGNVESIITVDKHAEGIVAMPMQ
ncbi:hypothetical protein [Bifidobacterium pseudolongum]|uniref:hypothetical protein n=1 Tax=Bifidobacterium pseudolongum TaxID=1694 RepID=UPI001F5CAE7A|nr:hypothetical protein [Bifidobacterium pseudolongum]